METVRFRASDLFQLSRADIYYLSGQLESGRAKTGMFIQFPEGFPLSTARITGVEFADTPHKQESHLILSFQSDRLFDLLACKAMLKDQSVFLIEAS